MAPLCFIKHGGKILSMINPRLFKLYFLRSNTTFKILDKEKTNIIGYKKTQKINKNKQIR